MLNDCQCIFFPKHNAYLNKFQLASTKKISHQSNRKYSRCWETETFRALNVFDSTKRPPPYSHILVKQHKFCARVSDLRKANNSMAVSVLCTIRLQSASCAQFDCSQRLVHNSMVVSVLCTIRLQSASCAQFNCSQRLVHNSIAVSVLYTIRHLNLIWLSLWLKIIRFKDFL